ncbi:effector-associated constant component EACC1 [Paractinoplanes toevensis]|uniref:Uncharacterized protein n=1 Tax=Paractinoplanes toevensis TaxID=571911 RepID=A0A919WCV5_9ACTN|nr:hypothetical protein [Actinoplanes toevensis]GIM97811.1 hypothetical protein Ato02nite_096040 [Actinoplanes toevensis]
MRLQLRVEADPDEVESLREWMAADPEIQRGGDLRYGRATDPAHQGVDIEVLSLAITSTLTTGNLIIQVLNWRRTRPNPPAITVSQDRPDGTVVKIETSDPAAAAEVARRLNNG